MEKMMQTFIWEILRFQLIITGQDNNMLHLRRQRALKEDKVGNLKHVEYLGEFSEMETKEQRGSKNNLMVSIQQKEGRKTMQEKRGSPSIKAKGTEQGLAVKTQVRQRKQGRIRARVRKGKVGQGETSVRQGLEIKAEST